MIVAQPPRRTVRRWVPALFVAALLAVCCTTTALAAVSSPSHVERQSSLAGKWKGNYSGAVSGHFTLHWKETGSVLTGKIKLSSPAGKYGITGSVHHGKVKFGAVAVGAKYKGSLDSPTSMSGTWTSPEGGGSWSANKVS